MRTLKFRTWSKQAQCIIPWEELKPKFVKLLDNPEYPYMQFTGLLDKSGVEIYEGDIVKYSAFNEQKELQNYINPIFWEQNFASFSVGNEHSFWALSTCEDVEVVGNIYENPELLKK